MKKNSFAKHLKRLLGLYSEASEEFFDDLLDSLIEADIGAKTAYELIETLQNKIKMGKNFDSNEVLFALKELLLPWVIPYTYEFDPQKVNIFLILGVNGVGKTTSVAKLAHLYSTQNKGNLIMAAADTFRAAAVDQLKLHGEKIGIRVVAHGQGADPSSVIFDAADAIRSIGGGLVLADTAGRLHNKENLVRELQKIDRIASSKADENSYKKILVIDGTTGQNGLRQTEVFHEAIGIDAIILTKYDSTARGGIIVNIGKELNIPVAYIGTGETYTDFLQFDPAVYLEELLGL